MVYIFHLKIGVLHQTFQKQPQQPAKKLKSDLQKLETYILDKVNEANGRGTLINTAWLKHSINLHFGRVTENKQSDLLIDAIQSIIDEAPTRKNAKGGIGLSKAELMDTFH